MIDLPTTARLARWRRAVRAVRAQEALLEGEDEEQLRRRSLALRYRAKSREPLGRLLPEAFALVCEAARRTLNMRPFDVQLLGGVALHHGACAEMQTGEGKTLTATLPLYLYALSGRGAHLATANDYLAQRDAESMGPIYRMLGLSVGVVEANTQRAGRRAAYLCDVTYGTAREFGFDFLRDRLLLRASGSGGAAPMWAGVADSSDRPVQRAPHFALIDEADSLLIDEARTPLIISAPPGEAARDAAEVYAWAADAVGSFEEDEHYTYDEKTHGYELTPEGRRLARTLPKPSALRPVPLLELYEYIERGLRARKQFHLDQHYVVRDGEIVIVDEFTGRLGEGRKWRDGLHQAIEAKERIKVSLDGGHAARVCVQDYFRRYERLAGMTGTALSSAREFKSVYKLRVMAIPTNRPMARAALPPRVLPTEQQKWAAIVEEVRQMLDAGRPVLIGTRSIDKSERLSALLRAEGIAHQVLNARRLAAEADIVSLAGQQGRVTVSTNMAGRGTDIRLGAGVGELGGLHVICTEIHDSARVDRQLIGRCGRQGDPGSYRMFMSLEDEILHTAWPETYRTEAAHGAEPSPAPAPAPATEGGGEVPRGDAALFRRAQKRVERRHYRDRKILLYHEQQRRKLHEQMGLDPYLDTVV